MRRHSRCLLSEYTYYVTLVAIFVTMMSSTAESAAQEKLSVLTGKYSGWFSSPGYPHPYPVNVSYTWIFPKYDHDVVLVKFVDMDLYLCYVVDLNENCYKYDHVHVEGHRPFCNWRMPKDVITLSERTVIKFRTFPSRDACRGKGFNATFKVVSAKIHGKTTLKPMNATTIDTTEGGQANENSTRTVVIIIVAVLMTFSVMFLILCVWCWKRKKRQRFERRDGDRTRSYSSLPAQERDQTLDPQIHRDNEVSYHSGLIPIESVPRRQGGLIPLEDLGVPRGQGPPPTYESVFNAENTSQRENDVNREAEFENPPSYETALRERHTQRERRSAPRWTNNASRGPTRRGQRNVRETAEQSLSRDNSHTSRDDETGESANQRQADSSCQTMNTSNQSDPVENSLESPTDSSETENPNIVVSESSEASCPDDSRREVFV